MLFDLRGRRKRLIQVIYALLAGAFLIGFVGFGVGTGGDLFSGGSIFDVFSGGGGGSTIDKKVEKYQKAVAKNPQNEKAWETLITTEFQVTQSPKNYNQQTGQPTKDGVQELRKLAQFWEGYQKSKPASVPTTVVIAATQAYVGLRMFDKAAGAQEIVIEKRPNANNFYRLAVLAYQAGQVRKGDLAGQRAVDLAPKSQRKQVKSQLKQAKKAAIAQQAQQVQQGQASGQPPAQQGPQ